MLPARLHRGCVNLSLPAVIHKWPWAGCLFILNSVAVFVTLMLITWVAGSPEMGHRVALTLAGDNPLGMHLEHEASPLLHSVWVTSLSMMASGFIGVVTHGRTSLSLRQVTLPRYGYGAFHYLCIPGPSLGQWTAVCGWHSLVVVDNGPVDTGVCISPGGPDVPFSGFTPRNGSKENSFSSALVVKNSPGNTGDGISLFLDISRVYRRYTCY